MDAIGRDGLQMFVDVGQPVDNSLVNALIKEVLTEKVVTMIGQRPDDEEVRGQPVESREEVKMGAQTKASSGRVAESGIRDEVCGKIELNIVI